MKRILATIFSVVLITELTACVIIKGVDDIASTPIQVPILATRFFRSRVFVKKPSTMTPGGYGKWCGTGGPSSNEDQTPIDDLDRACMHHDECYGRQQENNTVSPYIFSFSCDLALAREAYEVWCKLEQERQTLYRKRLEEYNIEKARGGLWKSIFSMPPIPPDAGGEQINAMTVVQFVKLKTLFLVTSLELPSCTPEIHQ